jgi:hypothetical protein
MKTISQYLEEFEEKFGYPTLNCIAPQQGEAIEDVLRTALTEVAKGMVGEKKEPTCFRNGNTHTFCGNSFNSAIAEQEEKLKELMK